MPRIVAAGPLTSRQKHTHLLFLAPKADALPALPQQAFWQAQLARRALRAKELAVAPLVADLPDHSRAALVMIDPAASRFERLTLLRKALTPMLEEGPKSLALVDLGVSEDDLRDAAYCAWINGVPLPSRKRKPAKSLEEILVHGPRRFSAQAAAHLAEANLLARTLTAAPPNELTPPAYRRRLKQLAKEKGWRHQEWDFRALRKMGAGAFCAVAQGSGEADAAIVRLSWRPRGGAVKGHVALVGKGICFDTGGHNLKTAKGMQGMHEDMAGSAVAVALLQAASDLNLPVAVDAWLAIARNHLSPEAYQQGDVVTALNGTTIEVVHTDAEGRMVLADTLALAARDKPDLMIDFATLTGAMIYSLGTRYSGVFASDTALGDLARYAGEASGERVWPFPMDKDYDAALDSRVADVKQCLMAGEADHILAARFLSRFTGDVPWLHVDLSAIACEGGLGAVATQQTGFGVAWGAHLLSAWPGRKGKK